MKQKNRTSLKCVKNVHEMFRLRHKTQSRLYLIVCVISENSIDPL